jgi:serine/threonine protein kinase
VFKVGDVVGTYTVLAHLRSGGMADLYLARRDGAAGFRRLVAIKVIHPRHAEDQQLVRMFLDEALISARVDHPNVVHVEDLGENDQTYFLVMEYVHGCSLAHLMRVLGTMHRRLSPLVAVAIAARVAEGLHAAHETTDDEGKLVALVHRDVSPQNILLSHKGHVKLIDFGVAKARLRSEETNVAMLKGKVRYMAPEQATTGLVDRRSDVYSLAIVLWEMLTMRRLFAGKTEFEVLLKVRDPKVAPPSRFVPDVPPELDDVVMGALARAPDDRPQNAKIFRRLLAQAMPRAMSLDSAHIADLLLSVVGEELSDRREELPDEVSRILGAEEMRLAGLEKAERPKSSESAVEVMTIHTDMAKFEEDELDRAPSSTAIPFEGSTKPGSPIAIARSAEMAAVPAPVDMASLPTPPPPTDDDYEATEVADVPREIRAVRALAALEDSDDASTFDRPRPEGLPPLGAPVPSLTQPPAIAMFSAPPPPSTPDSMMIERPGARYAPYIVAAAVVVIVAISALAAWSAMG